MDMGFKFYINGSNASLLSRELGTRLTGRYVPDEFARIHPEGLLKLIQHFHRFKGNRDKQTTQHQHGFAHDRAQDARTVEIRPAPHCHAHLPQAMRFEQGFGHLAAHLPLAGRSGVRLVFGQRPAVGITVHVQVFTHTQFRAIGGKPGPAPSAGHNGRQPELPELLHTVHRPSR
jgi:hypothetical protein